MHYKIKILFLYFCKKIEWRIKTRLKQRQIITAYHPEKAILPKLALIVACTLAILAVALLAPQLIKILRGVFTANIIAITVATKPDKALQLAKDDVQPNIVLSPTTTKAATTDSLVFPQLPAYSWPLSLEFKYVIFANKATQRLYLIEVRDLELIIVNHWFVTTGSERGPKERSNDKRTPEGVYFIIGKKTKSELSSSYGPMAFILNYPNEVDRKAGRNGQGIWIHGTPENTLPVATRGCLQLHNRDLLDLSSRIGIGIGTPVIIVDSPDSAKAFSSLEVTLLRDSRKQFLKDFIDKQIEFLTLIEKWKNAWESKNIEIYSSFYDTAFFFGDGNRWTSWRNRKQSTFRLYKEISITPNNVILSDISDSSATVKLIQKYESNINQSTIAKKLIFVRRNGEWKIRSESTFPQEELFL